MFLETTEQRDAEMSSCKTKSSWIFLALSFVEFGAELFLVVFGWLFVVFLVYKCLTKYDYPFVRIFFAIVNCYIKADLILQTVVAVELVFCWGKRLPVAQGLLSLWLFNRYRLKPAGNIGLFDPVDFYKGKVKWQYAVELFLLLCVNSGLVSDTKQQFYSLSQEYSALQDTCHNHGVFHFGDDML